VSPWYLKSYIYTRNPIWPFLNSLFGGQYWDAVGDSRHLGYLRLTNVKFSIGNLLLGPWRLTTNPVRFGGYGPGVLLLWLAPFAPVLADRASRKLIYPLTILCVTFYGIWFLLSQQTRFLAPVVPALCVLSATAGRRLMQKGWLSLVFQCMVVVMMAAELPCWYPDQVQLWSDRLGYLGGRVSREEFLRSHIEPFSAFEYCNQRLPADARILLFPYENRGYYLDRPYMWGNLITQRYIRFEQFKDAHALWQGLQALGVTHILDRPAFTHATFARGLALPSWEHDRRTMDELERDYAVLLFQKDSTWVYELRK
jgi:hypothetical protein